MKPVRPLLLTIGALAAVLANPLAHGARAQWWGGGGGDIELPPLKGPVVVELFTSQSCSSCPPADEVLSEVAKHENVIALGCHVTYWDHLNWKDTLSLPVCTERQRAYAGQKGSGRVYTPQMVVNGDAEFVGSNRIDARREIAKAANGLAAIVLERDGDTLTARLPALTGPARPHTLWLTVIAPDHTQAVRSGENRGRTIDYTHPVKELADIGPWNGEARSVAIALPAAARDGKVQGLALLANAGRTGPIAAAGVWTAPQP